MKNYTDETFLKGFVPALTKLLWAGETTYDKQKANAELIVRNDFVARGYNIAFIQVPLILRESEVITEDELTPAVNDEVTRLRYVYSVTTFTAGGTKTITLQGCNTEDGTYTDLNTFTITAVTTTDATGYISDVYKYYKLSTVVTAGTLDFAFKLVESSYDLFFAYKWLELILMDSYKNENDQFFLKMLEFRNLYNELWNNVSINEDTNEDGELNEDESDNHITLAP
jgi:hypothetical protein